ncbi:MAG: hypothetical protein P1T08_06525 [Acidimicrobiia bacterium]|nr:hypothetical protein [Acidimicrobiia bacterium]
MTTSNLPSPRKLAAVEPEPDPDARQLSDVELDRRIRTGWDVWCDLLDDLLNTGGMLPPRDLAGRVTAFFEDGYWRAEAARTEALRRQLSTTRRDSRQPARSMGLA